MSLNKRRVLIIAFYFFSFAAGGVIKPFLNLYLVEKGFSGTQIGLLFGYTSLIIVGITPLIGWLADRTQRHRLILGIIVVIKGLSAPALLFSNAWGWLISTVSVRMVAAGAQDALMNQLTIAHLKEQNQNQFGRIRMWGVLGFASASLVTGWVARENSAGILFPVAGVLGFIAGVCVIGFPSRLTPENKKPTDVSIIRSSSVLALFFLIFILSFARSGYDAFSNIYIKAILGADNAWIGLLSAIGSVTPALVFSLTDKVHQRLGYAFTLGAGLLLGIIALILLALAPNLYWTFPAVIFYSASEALFIISMILLLTKIGKREHAATDQMLALLSIPGLAGLFAQPISGWIFDAYGGSTLFFIDAILVILAFVFLVFYHKKMH